MGYMGHNATDGQLLETTSQTTITDDKKRSCRRWTPGGVKSFTDQQPTSPAPLAPFPRFLSQHPGPSE